MSRRTWPARPRTTWGPTAACRASSRDAPGSGLNGRVVSCPGMIIWAFPARIGQKPGSRFPARGEKGRGGGVDFHKAILLRSKILSASLIVARHNYPINDGTTPARSRKQNAPCAILVRRAGTGALLSGRARRKMDHTRRARLLTRARVVSKKRITPPHRRRRRGRIPHHLEIFLCARTHAPACS